MGFYDYRCMLTGVSLNGDDAVLVPLFSSDGQPAPIAFGVKGSYNRLGAIDSIEKDANTDAILRFFLDKLAAREYVVDEDYLRRHRAFPITDIERLVAGFERNVTDHPQAALLNNCPVVYGLINRSVWDAIARAAAPFSSDENVLQKLFAGSPVARQIYGDRFDHLGRHAHELAAVTALMRRRQLAWSVPSDPAQWYAEEMLRFLSEARVAFNDCPTVLDGLLAYERAAAELLKD